MRLRRFSPMVRDVASDWLATVRVSERVRENYEAYLRNWVLPELGDVRVSSLSAGHVERLMLLMDRCGRRPQTVRHVFNVVSMLSKWAMREGLLERSPLEHVKPPRVGTAQVTIPDEVDVRRLLVAATGWPGRPTGWMHVFLTAAVETGARRGELLALQWEDVRGDVITIRSSVTLLKGGPVLKGTKTDRPRRLAAPVSVESMLTLPRRGRFVFGGPKGQLRAPNAVSFEYVKLCRSIGVKARLHDLRHFNATVLISSGVDVRTVAQRLGHSRPSTTLDVYSHWLPSADAKAAAVIGRTLLG
ncbi:MAG: tyrosine-type recombinase/integrase [Acidimicrobiales bacterium]